MDSPAIQRRLLFVAAVALYAVLVVPLYGVVGPPVGAFAIGPSLAAGLYGAAAQGSGWDSW